MGNKPTWRYADGHSVFDTSGKQYIDFTSGIFAANLGHNNSSVREAIKEQADIFHHAYTWPTEIRAKYEAALCEYTGFEAAALFSSGTEATEAAMRVMRKQMQNEWMLKIRGGFHGRTAGVQDDAAYIKTIEFPDKKNNPLEVSPFLDIAGIILEPYRAKDAHFYPCGWVDALFEMQDRFGFLICFDEIQAGFWRTGKLFGHNHYGVAPDLVTIGKGMGNGFPVSGLLARKKEMFDGVPLSSTNGGNPLACAAGLAALGEYKKYEADNASFWYVKAFEKEVKTLPVKSNVTGMVAGLYFNSKEQADRITQGCQDRGLLVVNTGGQTIKLGPPLVITADAIIRGIEILREVINDCNAQARRNIS